jgi:uncharacterized protein
VPKQQHESTSKRLIKSETEFSVNEQLLRAAPKGSLEQVKALLSKGADVNAKDETGKTVLMYAIGEYPHNLIDLEVVQLLIDKGAGVTATDNEGNTALKLAQKTGSKEIVELLKSHGAEE